MARKAGKAKRKAKKYGVKQAAMICAAGAYIMKKSTRKKKSARKGKKKS